MPKLALSPIVHARLWPARVAQARRDLAMPASLDDRDLADIGLGRHDLRDATAVGLGKDPTELLAARARAGKAALLRGARPLYLASSTGLAAPGLFGCVVQFAGGRS